MMIKRPQRTVAQDFSGRKISLSSEWQAWQKLKIGLKGILILGLGPSDILKFPEELVDKPIYWFEEPNMWAKISCQHHLPANWHKLTVEELQVYFNACTVFFYRANMFLRPEFWGQLLGQLFAAWAVLAQPNNLPTKRAVLLFGAQNKLLHFEISTAFQELG